MRLGKWCFGLPMEFVWVWRWWRARREGERTIRRAMELREVCAATTTMPLPRIQPELVEPCEAARSPVVSGR